eukprot:s2313_g11.t1
MPFWRLLAIAPFFADALDCSDRSDPVVATCCDAQSAWFSMEAAGGCGGEGATDNHCAHAADLCQRCRAAVDGTEKDGDPLLDQKLSSLDIGFLEMTCVLPQWSPCGVTPTDDTMLPLLVAGALLFLLTLGLVIFDRRVVPCVIGKRLTEEEKCKAVDEGATSLGQPHLVPSSGTDVLRLAAAMPMENIQLSFGNARGRALVAALWTIFLPVSSVAVLARVALIIAYRVALPRQLPVARAVLELFLALVPFLWCVCRVRSASAAQVAFCGPGSRCQRFTSFALVTVAAEMYSTICASMAVATTPCGASPWPPLLFYCLGVMVTVLRCYSSVLAVRLQDFAAGTCRRAQSSRVNGLIPVSVQMVAEKSPLWWLSLISWLSLMQKQEIDDNSVECLLRLIDQNPKSFKSFIRRQRAETFPDFPDEEVVEAPEAPREAPRARKGSFEVEEDEVGTALLHMSPTRKCGTLRRCDSKECRSYSLSL